MVSTINPNSLDFFFKFCLNAVVKSFFFFLNFCCQLNVCVCTCIYTFYFYFFFPATETSVRLSAVLFPQHAGTHSLNGPFVKLFEGITPQQSLRSGHLLHVDGRAVLEWRHSVKVTCVLCFSRATPHTPHTPLQKFFLKISHLFLESWNSSLLHAKGHKRASLGGPEIP